MFTEIDVDEATAQSVVSTGHLPPEQEVATLIDRGVRALQIPG